MSDLRTLDELAAAARREVMGVARDVEGRRNKSGVLDRIADLYVTLTLMHGRVSAQGEEFAARPVRRGEEDERSAGDLALDRQAVTMSLSEVYADDGEVRPVASDVTLAREVMGALDEDAGAILIHEALRAAHRRVLMAMITYIWHGARSPWEMMKRALAITRRYYSARLKGISMTEVAALLGDDSRCAGQSAREKLIHDELLRRWGIKAPKAADGALRGETTCEKNRVRAMGNSNRKGKGLGPRVRR